MASCVSLSLPESLIQAIDRKRQLVSRSKFCSKLLQASLAGNTTTTEGSNK